MTLLQKTKILPAAFDVLTDCTPAALQAVSSLSPAGTSLIWTLVQLVSLSSKLCARIGAACCVTPNYTPQPRLYSTLLLGASTLGYQAQ